MDWTQGPFITLRNMFPQVDDRLIKATVLDHGNDIEAAIDFIRHEVLNSDVEVNIVPGFLSNTYPVASAVSVSDSASNSMTVIDHSRNSARNAVEVDCNEHEESIVWLSDFVSKPAVSNYFQSPLNDIIEIKGNNSYSTGFPTISGNDRSICKTNNELDLEDNHVQSVTGVVKNEEIVLSEKNSPRFSASVPNIFQNSDAKSEEVISNQSSMLHPVDPTSEQFEEEQFDPEALSDRHTEECTLHYPSPLYGLEDSIPHYFTNDIGVKLEENCWGRDDTHYDDSVSEAEHSWLDFQPKSQLTITYEDNASWRRTSNISDFNIDIESLEQVVNEAKKDKEVLMKTIEDIKALWLRADDEESAACKAKIDAAMAGQDTLKNAEELRKTAASLRAANEMRAGEIFGEKAVLATEARELRSRLAELKAQKLKAVALLTDIQSGLQARYESAANERADAEEKKHRMELRADKILSIEESLLSKLVEESNDIDAEAEVCMRLKEFLLKQGNIADSIQGEVAILTEDIEMLKKQIEDGVPSASSGIHSIIRYSKALEGSSDFISNECTAASAQELPRESFSEGHSTIETGSCVILSSGKSMCQNPSIDSALKPLSPTFFLCNGNGAEQNINSLIKPVANLDVDDLAASGSALTGSVLGTKYLLDDNDTEVGSCHLPAQDLTILEAINRKDTLMKGTYDDGSWHVLSTASKDRSSTGSPLTSVCIQQMHDIVWETI